MLQVFLAIIVSGLLLLITATSLLVLPEGATATLVHPMPRYSVARIKYRLDHKLPLVRTKVDADMTNTGSAGQRVAKKESRPQ